MPAWLFIVWISVSGAAYPSMIGWVSFRNAEIPASEFSVERDTSSDTNEPWNLLYEKGDNVYRPAYFMDHVGGLKIAGIVTGSISPKKYGTTPERLREVVQSAGIVVPAEGSAGAVPTGPAPAETS